MLVEEEILKSKILIVDDEPANIKLLEKALDQEGFTNVRSVQDSRKVLGIFKEFNPHLVLLDLRMPHLDGFQVMEQLSEIEQKSYAPIMVLTAEDESHIRLRALNSGAVDFLSKPFDYSEVILRIKNTLKMRLLINAQQTNKTGVEEDLVREFSRKSHNVDIDVIQSLCRANETHSRQSGDNFIRVSHYAFLLGKDMGFTDQQCNDLKFASSTYDIGKIGVPIPLLNKTTKLTQEELELIKTHTNLGADLLSGSDTKIMKMARKIALEHHEKWDGSGYPMGLKGEEICLEARIVAICEVFDAMTSKRPYRPKFSNEESISFIEENAGIHFDPQLIPNFKNIFSKILKSKEELTDENKTNPLFIENKYKFKPDVIPRLKATLPKIFTPHYDQVILLVDDSKAMRSAIKSVVKKLGFKFENILEASSGSIALKKLEQNQVFLVITDLYMPHMSGLELVSKIREYPKFKNLPIIIVSEENREKIIREIVQVGANQYLLKPFNGYQLEEKINQALFSLAEAAT
ncbi:MAG: putative two-component system response regulator [Nitrospinales bacterium]|jgi:putative two-component system response regulator